MKLTNADFPEEEDSSSSLLDDFDLKMSNIISTEKPRPVDKESSGDE
jgi:hypothetical protein